MVDRSGRVVTGWCCVGRANRFLGEKHATEFYAGRLPLKPGPTSRMALHLIYVSDVAGGRRSPGLRSSTASRTRALGRGPAWRDAYVRVWRWFIQPAEWFDPAAGRVVIAATNRLGAFPYQPAKAPWS